MTTLREAAQQALDALEKIADEVFSPYDNKLGDAILALRAALAEPENWELRRLSEELERCKQVCAATSEAWREEAALGCDHCNHPMYAAIKCRVCGRVTEPVQEPVQEPVWVCPDSAEHRYQKPGHCEDCGKTLVQETT